MVMVDLSILNGVTNRLMGGHHLAADLHGLPRADARMVESFECLGAVGGR